jgi:hypothetical protein
MPTALRYFLDRTQEPSTWRGIIMLLAAFGVVIQPELAAAITAAGMAGSGLIGVLTKGR